jgi:large subunit ribosomal protein L4
MATIKVLDSKGKEKGSVDLKAPVEAKPSVLHRAIVSEEANSRQGTQKAKTRAEVRGGGRKPYRQKKTGRARQGSISAPHYRKGGVVFAPVPRDYGKKMNKKERRLALRAALATQADAGNLIVVDKIEFAAPKTKDAAALLKAVGAESRRVLVILPAYDENTLKAFRNLPHVEVRTAPSNSKQDEGAKSQGFSTRDLLVAHRVVIAKDALNAIQEAWA